MLLSRQRSIALLILALPIWSSLLAQSVIPAERLCNWSTAGLREANVPIIQSINFAEVGGVPDGLSANDNAFQNILNNLPGGQLEIYFPEGDYLFKQPLTLPGNILLRGSDHQQSRLLFDQEGADHLIKAEGSTDTLHQTLAMDAFAQQQSLTVTDASSFAPGDFIMVQDDDSDLVTSDWAVYSSGQLLRITAINGNVIQLLYPLRRDFTIARQAKIRRYFPIQNIGIEQLVVERMDSTSTQTSNFFFQYASNCWLRCVESRRCNFAHVDLRFSSNMEITGSYFQDAFDFGNGGKAYGVIMHFASGDNLLYDCNFRRLRHAMILQAGANGNVFAYNYSKEPYWTEVSLPASSAGDMVLHGNYPYGNLFEGNICQNIVIDDSHGVNGPFNTFFRNRAEHYGIFMNPILPSDSQNFIANEISSVDSFGFYFIFGQDQYELANNDQGVLTPANSAIPSENSLFLDTIPLVFQNDNWPPIGLPNNLNTFSIPAKERFDDGRYTSCDPGHQVSDVQELETTVTLLLFPNPVHEILQVKLTDASKADWLSIYSLSGVLMEDRPFTASLAVGDLAPGVYLVVVMLENGVVVYGKMVKALLGY
jgi:Pectate lyase superfamily protein